MPEFELRLKLNKDGSVDISGPIANKVLCYGVLEAGKEAIADWNRKQAEGPKIAVAHGSLPPEAVAG